MRISRSCCITTTELIIKQVVNAPIDVNSIGIKKRQLFQTPSTMCTMSAKAYANANNIRVQEYKLFQTPSITPPMSYNVLTNPTDIHKKPDEL